MKKIKLKMSVMSVIITAVVIACVFVINFIVGTIADMKPMKVDLTKDKIYEFSNQTKDVMKKLDKDVTAYALIPGGLENDYTNYIKDYLDKYKSLNKKFKVQYIDPYENTAFMSKYANTEQNLDIGTVIIECGEMHRILPLEQLYTQSYFEDTEHIDVERRITNAIMVVTGEFVEANVCFDISHAAPGFETAANITASLLASEGYNCEFVNILKDGIPENANILIGVMPVNDYNDKEIGYLNSFLDNGGRFMVMLNANQQPLENLDTFLEEWGIKLNYDYVIEADEEHIIVDDKGTPVPIAKMENHTITENLMNSDKPLVMPSSMSMSIVKSSNNSDAVQLLTTTEKAYGKMNFENNIDKEEGDIEGPLCMAAVALEMDEEISGVMVLGSTQAFADLNILADGNYMNQDFLLNSIGYLSGNKETMDIRAKQITPEEMIVTQQQYKVINIALVWIIPIVIILLGLVIWLRRRFK